MITYNMSKPSMQCKTNFYSDQHLNDYAKQMQQMLSMVI
jgi:hypothetical protein